jgi:HEPN domain-containing protein/predicted nucleotidyltransferase
MKTSLSHLPGKKQFEINLITDVIKEVVDPEMIILFGSHAKGTYVEDRYVSNGITYEYISDYDFLVVTKESLEKTYSLESKIVAKVDRLKPPVNLEIHGIEYINKGLEWGEYFWVDIVKEGIVLFDKDTIQFAEPRELSADEKKEKAKRYFDTWFPQGNEFLIDANHAASRKNLKKATFELHQATESLYYAFLLVFTEYKPKTHNLWKLRKKAKLYSKELFHLFAAETDKEEERLFELLKQGYIDARYREDFTITESDLNKLIEKITLMIPLVERVCNEKIVSITE